MTQIKTKETITAFFHSVYNTCLEYHGERREVLDFLRYFDIWGGHGQRIEENGKTYYRFEMSKDFYAYMHTEDFKRIMNQKFNIEVICTN